MEREETTDQQNPTQNRSSSESEKKVPDNSWKNDVFDETDPNLDNEPKDPQRTLFY
jgi:hypothetical protein